MIENKVKATFIQRFLAFILDVMIISCVSSLIAGPFMDYRSIDKINNQMEETMNKMVAQEIPVTEYIDNYSSLTYRLAKYQGIELFVSLFLSILYFVVYQFYNHGQTLGKKILRIKVVSESDDLTINDLILRSLLINSILVGFLQLILISFVNNAESYILVELIIEMVQILIVFGSGLMIMFGKNKRGIHDYVAHTNVVRV